MKKIKAFLVFMSVVLLGASEASAQYCTPLFGTPCVSASTNDFIASFSTSNALCNIVNNNSGCNGQPNNYIYYAAQTVTVNPGQTFNISVQSSTIYQQGFGIWIDWNNNNSFLDPGEYVWNSGVSGFAPFNGTITVPAGATLGIKRMRVRSNFAGIPNHPCNNQTYGEVEDYNVEVTTAPPLQAPMSSNVTICAGQSASLAAVGSGTLQWFTVPVGGVAVGTGAVYNTPILNNTTTFYVQSVLGNCVSPRTPVVVTVAPLTITLVASDLIVCVDGTSTLTASGGDTYTWTSSNLPSLSATTGNPVTVTADMQATYTVTGTDVNGCTGTATITIDVHAIPQATVNANPPQICVGASTALTASGGVDYTWSPATGLNTTTGANVTCNAAITTTYDITVTDANGCTGISQYTQIVNPLPVADAGPDAAVCGGLATTLNATGGVAYSWSPAIGLSATNVADPVASPAAQTTYTVTVTDANGCTSTDDIVVFVNPLPIATVGADQTICTGASAVINGNGGVTYQWTPATGLNDATLQNPTASPNVTTNYSLVVTDANGCVSAPSAPVTVVVVPQPPAPTINASGPIAFCDGGSVTLTSSVAGNNTWSTSAVANSITVSTSGNYTAFYFDANGCQSATSAPTTVTVHPLPAAPTITAGGPLSFCNGGSVTLSAPAGYTYAWSTGETTQAITVSTAGAFSVTVTDGNGCTAVSANTNTALFPIPPAPVITTSGPTSFCDGGNVTLSGPAAQSYTWSTGATTSNILVNTSQNGITLSIVDMNGCPSPPSNPMNVTVFPTPLAPVINAGGPAAFCQGGNVVLSTVPANSYLWNNGATTANITVSSGGNYTVTIVDGNGCTSPASAPFVVTVWPLPSPPVISANGPLTFCINDNVVLTSNQPNGNTWSTGSTDNSITVTTGGQYTVTFTDANGCVSLPSNPAVVNVQPLAPTPTITLSGPATICQGDSVMLMCSQAQTYLWSNGATTSSIIVYDAGTYTVTVTDVCNPANPLADATVNVNPRPVADFYTPTPEVCIPANVEFINSGSQAVQYLWSSGDGNFGSGSSFVHSYQFPGDYTVSLSIMDANGCTDTEEKSLYVKVKVRPEVSVQVSEHIVETDNAGVTLINETPDLSSFTWDIEGLGTFSNNPLQIKFDGQGIYTVSMTGISIEGCPVEWTDSIRVIESLRFFAPTAFTPNGDGLNDIFRPLASGMFSNNYHLLIFDRWGGVVFESRNKEIGWDAGGPGGIPNGVYLWKVTIGHPEGYDKEYFGEVTLLR
jgi:gliding motility-associated-like protein